MEIKALTFVSCGRFDYSSSFFTIYRLLGGEVVEARNVFPAISAELIQRICLVSCQFEYNVLALKLTKSEAYTIDSKFINNTGGLGGAIAADDRSAVFFQEHNYFKP